MSEPTQQPFDAGKDAVEGLETIMGNLSSVLKADKSGQGELAQAWHYLQVYSCWGKRLPYTDDKLKAYLKIDAAIPKPFYSLMLDGYKAIKDASDFFTETVMTNIDQVNRGLDRYTKEKDVFELIVEMADSLAEDPDNEELSKAILEMISDLDKQAKENEKYAVNTMSSLTTYSDQLTNALGLVQDAKASVNSDKDYSEGRLATLQGAEGVAGSVRDFKALMEKHRAAYRENTTIAATSPTYAWVFPFGTVAAAVIAGVYGRRAVESLEMFLERQAEFEAANKELTTLLKTHEVQSLAHESLTESEKFTKLAKEKTATVQTAWSNLSSNLTAIKDKVVGMRNGEGERKSLILVRSYALIAGKRFDEIKPMVKALNDDFFLKMEEGEKSADSLLAEVKMGLSQESRMN